MKEITGHPSILNIITEILLNITNDYIPNSAEWRIVDNKFMEKAISYYLQARKRLNDVPTLFIVCNESVQNSVLKKLRKCDDLPCYQAISDFWAEKCYIMDNNCMQGCISEYTELDPFAAFGLFTTNQTTPIDIVPINTYLTIQMLDISYIT
ncbi:uncharacterized protein EV154DRAFT_484382 [Mucor mucedo]|uniref:uncharacterized protein n=1 Tax=Mucor mucedo TaxID=29922 RepID=UPI002220E3EF|nr:uncharacterized protein EV154DRAFT_484382 [Mucor mucedo]KAI7888188.1 hypothetical protein EV154DRAFT_484382 [Mucor mucedo]